MSVNDVSTFFAVGAIAIAAIVVLLVVLWALSLASSRADALWNLVVDSTGESALWLAWLVALIATAGSLYYSEVAHFEPCTFCWYQRIAMYPLSVVLLVGALTRERRMAGYVLPLAVIGGGLAAYHYLIQQFPRLSTAACSIDVPCTAAWVWKFDFVSIPFMALVCFAAIIALVLIHRTYEAEVSDPRPVSEAF